MNPHLSLAVLLLLPLTAVDAAEHSPEEVLSGLRNFYRQTAQPDGSFRPGVDPEYKGMSDSAYSDLAAVTYAVTLHATFGWELPDKAKTIEFLLSRQKENGDFFNVAGTVDPASAEGRVYNTTQGLVALHALGVKPRFNPLPVFEEILKADYKSLPAYSTSFFPLAYLCAGQAIPEKADRGIRALMVQDATGYTNDHVAATFHASHYYALVGEETPKSQEMVARILRDQKPDGSWLLNMPSRDRHATFDAVFTLVHEGENRDDCRAAVQRAARWALSCRNAHGGFGHYPGSTSDADANYFQTGTLVMAGFLKPVDPLPPHPELLSWGHLMPPGKRRANLAKLSLKHPAWTGAVAFSPNGDRLATGCADGMARVFDSASGKELLSIKGHGNVVATVHFSPDGRRLATGGYDHEAILWNAADAKMEHRLSGHGGAVTSVAFSPDGSLLATASLDRTVRLWSAASGELVRTLTGHRSWVNSVAFFQNGRRLASGSSDGTVKIWSVEDGAVLHSLTATKAEVRAVAVSPDGSHIAAGMRYGSIKVWKTDAWTEKHSWTGHPGDVWALAFSNEGDVLACADGDWNRGGFVTLRNMRTGNQTAGYQHTGEVLGLAISRQGNLMAAAGGDGSVKVWELAKQVQSNETPARERGTAVADGTRPATFPHRIWAACDFEGQTPDYAWFGPAEIKDIPAYPGNRTALAAAADSGGSAHALKTGMNPVPGPKMGKENHLYLRYRIKGTDEALFQHFSLTSEDNNHVRVTGLAQDKWSELTVNFSRDARRNDGTPGVPFKEGERMDDFQFYVGRPGAKDCSVVIDDVIFFANDPALPPEREPFPNRVILLAAFDTGTDAKSKPK
jgi:WD40 repeat protein